MSVASRHPTNELGKGGLGIPLDVMMVLLLGGATAIIGPSKWDEKALVVLLTFAYAAVDFLLVQPRAAKGSGLWVHRFKVLLILLIVVLVVVFPEIRAIVARHTKDPLQVHDGVIQVEEAIKFLLHGQDPYTVTYFNTPLAQWPYGRPYPNPALFYLAYPPVVFLAGTPLYVLSMATIGWYDQRFLYMMSFAVALVVVYRLGINRRASAAALAVVGINPTLVIYMIDGTNDILALAMLLLSLLALGRGRARLVLSAGLFGLACATKQTTWLFAPFYFLYLWSASGGAVRQRIQELTMFAVLPAGLVFTAILGPFLLWDARGLYHSLIAYPGGSAQHNYPINGSGAFGFHVLLRSERVWRAVDSMTRGPLHVLRPILYRFKVTDELARYPFWIFQVLFALPVAIFALLRQRRENQLPLALAGYAIFLGAYGYFSRFFNPNYLGFVGIILVLAFLVRDPLGANASEPMESGHPENVVRSLK